MTTGVRTTREQVRQRIIEIGIVPVVRASSADHARKAAEAVCAGGIPIVELTMTVPGAIELIADLRRTLDPEVLVGAGTVLDAHGKADHGRRAYSHRGDCGVEGRQ